MQADVDITSPTDSEELKHLVLVHTESFDDGIPLHQRVYWPAVAGSVVARLGAVTPEELIGPRPTAVAIDTVKLGKNVEWDATHTTVIAKRSGHLSLHDDTLDVLQELQIAGDLSPAGGIVDFPGRVAVRGNVLDSSKIAAEGDLIIQGSIEAASVTSQGNVTVWRGICCKDRGRVKATGSVTARFASNAIVEADGDIHIENEANNCQFICRKSFVAPEASIMSSHIIARTGIECLSVGSIAHVKTILELSIDADQIAALEKHLADYRSLQKLTHRIRETIAPLLQNPKALTAQQKEKATDLLYQADEAEAKSAILETKLSGPKEEMQRILDCTVKIREVLHAGSIIRFPGSEATVGESFKGPLTIACKSDHGETLIAIVDDVGRPLTKLFTVQTPTFNLMRQLPSASNTTTGTIDGR